MVAAAFAQHTDISRASERLEARPAEARIEWALEHLPGSFILSSSFGIQSAVLLHLATRIEPEPNPNYSVASSITALITRQLLSISASVKVG